MAHLTTSDGINLLNGALSKRKSNTRLSVTRVKPVKDPITGEVVGHGPNEFYTQEQRDYKNHPLTEREQAQRVKWQEACRLAAVIIRDKSHPRYMELYHRWRAHVSTAEKPMQFPNFVRAELARGG